MDLLEYELNAENSSFSIQRNWRRSRKEFVQYLIQKHVKENSKILDAGCGISPVASGLNSSFCIVGIDTEPKVIEYLKKNKRLKDEFQTADITKKLPFEDSSFDAVICVEVIEHLKHYESTLKEFKRILKKGGKLILTTPNYFSFWPIIEWIWSSRFFKNPHLHVSKTNLFKIKNVVGNDLNVVEYGTLFPLMSPFFVFKVLSDLIFKIEKKLRGLPTGLLSYVVAERSMR